ncbi:hypothetical protein J437_LFUL012708 [Ladona fulva]|uniref:Uncharacterized protein n=1 Tax=Ladona fulva TaxID=123851 RepID=A0A8K0P3N6_LADFU|nr:hypothetical protein J437_LFUL012708 [Ladona fulva]
MELKPKGKISMEDELLVLRRKVQNRWEAPPVEETLRRILLRLPFSLDAYRSLEEKTKLLDAALEQGNGDAILSNRWEAPPVEETLRRILLRLPFSLDAYRSLEEKTKLLDAALEQGNGDAILSLPELNNLLESLGRSREASIIQFNLAMRGVDNARTNPSRSQRVLNSLRNCLASHFSNGAAEMDRPFIVNAIKLFEWQMAADEKFKSMKGESSAEECTLGLAALATLSHSCRYHWEGNKPKSGVTDPLSPSALCQSLGISQRAYQWTALKVKAQEHNWEAGWFQGIRLIGGGSGAPMADVAAELHSQGAPEDVVVRYINLVEGIEERIALANRLQCYNAAIDIMKSQGDRLGIIKLKSRLPTGSEGELYAELILRSSTIRWKN